jgi:hypothetical protein
MGYKANRERAYEIYGIDLTDKNYNCHHIVTHEDKKNGLVPQNFDINCLSNLIPLKIRDHVSLHNKINALNQEFIDSKKNTQFYMEDLLIIEPVNKRSTSVDISKKIDDKKTRLWSWLKYKNKDEIFTRKQFQIWQSCGTF